MFTWPKYASCVEELWEEEVLADIPFADERCIAVPIFLTHGFTVPLQYRSRANI